MSPSVATPVIAPRTIGAILEGCTPPDDAQRAVGDVNGATPDAVIREAARTVERLKVESALAGKLLFSIRARKPGARWIGNSPRGFRLSSSPSFSTVALLTTIRGQGGLSSSSGTFARMARAVSLSPSFSAFPAFFIASLASSPVNTSFISAPSCTACQSSRISSCRAYTGPSAGCMAGDFIALVADERPEVRHRDPVVILFWRDADTVADDCREAAQGCYRDKRDGPLPIRTSSA